LWGQASLAWLSPLQPGVLRVGQRAALLARQPRKALQLVTPVESTPLAGKSQSTDGERRSAQRVQSPCVPPQHVPPWHAPLAQSESSWQAVPGWQRPQAMLDPPQSTPVSLPF
jgi:hypothetical protein